MAQLRIIICMSCKLRAFDRADWGDRNGQRLASRLSFSPSPSPIPLRPRCSVRLHISPLSCSTFESRHLRMAPPRADSTDAHMVTSLHQLARLEAPGA
jgi:hypothetical protein